MNTVRWEDSLLLAGPNPLCAVQSCWAEATDRHHWAVGSVFGAAQELWPTVMLCRFHHVQWHVRLSGYIWGGLRFIDNLADYRVA